MTKLVERLAWEDPPKGIWTEYGRVNTSTDADAEAKGAFVRAATGARRPSLVWDLGCNDGRYARIAVTEGAHVVALNSDQGPVEQLYERAAFGRCLGDAFEVERSASLASGTRVLYLAHPRGRPAAA